MLAIMSGPSLSPTNDETAKIGIDYVVILVMENASLNQTYDCHNYGCSYVSLLANDSSLARNYYSQWCSSLPNYLVLIGGSDFGNPLCTSCNPVQCGSFWPIDEQNIVDRIEGSGRTWKAYFEDYPSGGSDDNYSSGGCYLSVNGKYVSWHNPFIYFKDIENSANRCSKIFRANTLNSTEAPETDDVFLNDLQSVSTAANFMWLTPNNCDNSHDQCWGDSRYAGGDLYLSVLVPKILNSPVFKSQRAALFITWDEGACHDCSQELTSIWTGPVTKTRYCNCTTGPYYNHASFPKTLETIWNLQTLGQLDMTAPAMTEFFI